MKIRSSLLRLFLLLWLSTCLSASGADFWIFDKLPPPHDQTTGGSLHFKFVYLHTWNPLAFWSNDGSSKDGSEPKTSVSNGVTKGRFLIKLPVKNESSMDDEFLVRVWVSANARTGFQQLPSDYRLINAKLDPDKKTTSLVEMIVAGTVFSSASKAGDILTLGVGPNFRCLVKKRGSAGTFEHEATARTTVPLDSAGRMTLHSSLWLTDGKATHTCMRMGKGGAAAIPEQPKTAMPLKPVSAVRYGESRVWQNQAGRRINASLRHADNDAVVLKMADGNLILIDLATLPAEDQVYARDLIED